MQNNNSIVSGSVVKSLIKFTTPILLAMVLQTLYSTVDMFVVSNYATVADVSGVSSGSEILFMIISLCTGLANGATILIGQYIGQGAKEKVATVVGNSLIVFSAISIVITLLAVIFNGQIVDILNTPKEAIKATTDYIFYCSLGIPMIFLYNILSSFFRGIGNSNAALITIAFSCIINIILDFILVAHLQMGAAGAAIATVIAQAVSVIISFIIMSKMPALKINKASLILNFGYIKRVLTLGLPIAFQGILVSVSFTVIIVIINQFGLTYSAAAGVVGKIVGFIMLVPMSFGQASSVFASQNYGAGQHERAKKGLGIGIAISFSISVVMAYIAFFHGDILISFFNDDPELVAPAFDYLKSYAIDTLLVPIIFSLTGFISGYGKTFFVMIQSIIGAVGIRITCAYLFSLITPPSLFLIGLSTPIATFVQIIACTIFYLIKFNKSKVHDLQK